MAEQTRGEPDQSVVQARSNQPSLATVELIHAAAVEIAREAGAALLAQYAGPLEVRFKSKRETDPVTAADEAIEAHVRRAVAALFPEHGLLGEEGASAAENAEFLWVVDPLDGTANFANGLPLFAVSIAVLHRLEPVVGVLFTTFGPEGRPCLLHARRGGGLLRDGEPYTARTHALSRRARLSGVPAGFHRAFGLWRLRGKLPGETRSLGSIAVELGLVATGQLQYAIFGSPRLWDVAGGVLLVQESGGAVFVDVRRRWRRLRRFEQPAGKPLREWKQAVIAGDARLLAELTGKLRVRRSRLERLERLLGVERAARVRRTARMLIPAIRFAQHSSAFLARALRLRHRRHSG